MMAGIPIGQVEFPTHVEWPVVGAGPLGEDSFLFEVYAGNVLIGFQGGRSTEREDFSIYMPLQGNSIRTYGNISEGDPTPPVGNAILVTPIGFQGHEDEEFVCSVDSFGLRIAPQTFNGIGGEPLCLILDFRLAIRNGVIHRVGYNVTVNTPLPGHISGIDLTGAEAPQ
jgi:hypothetical protein